LQGVKSALRSGGYGNEVEALPLTLEADTETSSATPHADAETLLPIPKAGAETSSTTSVYRTCL